MKNIKYSNIFSIILLIQGFWILGLNITNPKIHSIISEEITIIIFTLSCLLSMFLYFSKRANNPLLLILIYHLITYYFLRIISIQYFEYSSVFDRFSGLKTDDVFEGVIIIFFSIAAMFFGWYLAQISNSSKREVKYYDTLPFNRISSIIVFYGFSIGLRLLVNHTDLGNNSILNIFSAFLFEPLILFFPILVYFIFTNFAQKIASVVFLFLFLFYLLYSVTYIGTRGDLVYLIEVIFFILLASNKLSIKRSLFWPMIVILPLTIFIVLNLYVFATLQRQVISNQNVQSSNIITQFTERYSSIDISYFISHAAARIGSFDYTIEILANKDKYKNIFNIEYYSQAVVDNVLTPGYDIYDTPRVGQSLVFNYSDLNNGFQSRKFLSLENSAHSDEITIIAEVYALMGWASTLFFFVISFFITKIYNINSKINFKSILVKSVILLFVSKSFHSFGLDWILVDLVKYLLILVPVYLMFFCRVRIT